MGQLLGGQRECVFTFVVHSSDKIMRQDDKEETEFEIIRRYDNEAGG